MKKTLCLLCLVLCSDTLLATSLEHCSIILWPKYDWLGSHLETVADRKMRDGDYIVYPGSLGMKGWFRSDEYQINKDRVMVQTTSGYTYLGSKHELEKKQAGIGGVFVKEDDMNGDIPLLKSKRLKLKEYLHENGQQLAYCMNREMTDHPRNLKFMADKCDQLVIYFDRALMLDPEKSIAYFRKTIAQLKDHRSGVQIFAGIELKLEDSSLEDILSLFESISQDIDGIMVVFEGTEAQKQIAIRLMNELRV